MMKILFCTMGATGETVSHLHAALGSVAGEKNVGVCRDAKVLQQELRNPWVGCDCVVLYAEDGPALEGYIALQELLEDAFVILVLPDGSAETLRRAHLLRPRFIAFASLEFADIRAVLEKRQKNLRRAS